MGVATTVVGGLSLIIGLIEIAANIVIIIAGIYVIRYIKNK